MSYYVYFIQIESDGPIKIGVTWDVPKRLYTLQGANPNELFVLGTVRCEDKWAAHALEQTLHHRFRAFGIRGEWFTNAPEVRAAIRHNGAPQKEQRTPPSPKMEDGLDTPPWADNVDRNNLATLSKKRRRRMVATTCAKYGVAATGS